jgi:small subunit ribosomal protein S1
MTTNETDGELNQEDFGRLLEDSLSKRDDFAVGDEVTGKAVFISKEFVFVDIAGKSEAVIDINEFRDDNEAVTIKVGDPVKAFVVSVRGGEIKLTTAIGRGGASLELIESSHKFNIPVEGAVVGTVKGGYSVSISGNLCFCPFSQMDIKSNPDPNTYVTKTFSFKVTQFGENGRNIVLSRRALLEEKREARQKELQETIHAGDTIEGSVKSIQNFGIIVDLEGVEAMVPRSEISWGRNTSMESFKIGQMISGKVISIEDNFKRIVLSLKQLKPEPWEKVKNFKVGQTINGVVVNIIKSGAFVELDPGLEGYIPVSRMSLTKRINKPEDAVSIGATVGVKIIDIRHDEKKISLELMTGEPDPWQLPAESVREKVFDGVIEAARQSGLSVRLSNGMLGFLPREELMSSKSDIQNAYPVGKEIKAAVKDIRMKDKKLILSEKDAASRKEYIEYEEYQKKSASDGQSSSLGNMLKNKFDEIQKKLEKK